MPYSRLYSKGMTLIETMFVLVIFSSVMAMLMSAFMTGATATRNFEDASVATMRLNEAARMVTDDLRHAVIIQNAIGGVEYPIVFATNANTARDGHTSADGQWNHPWESVTWTNNGSGEEAPAQIQYDIRDVIVFAKLRSASMGMTVQSETTGDEGGDFNFTTVSIDHDTDPVTPNINVGQFLGADGSAIEIDDVLEEIPFDYYDSAGDLITDRTNLTGVDIESVVIRNVDAFDNETLQPGGDGKPDLFAYYTVRTGIRDGVGLYDLVREDVSRGSSMVILRNVVRFEVRQDFVTNPYGSTKPLATVNDEFQIEGNKLIRNLDYSPAEVVLNPVANIGNVISNFALKPKYVGSPNKVFTNPYFLTFHIVTRPSARGRVGAEREVALTTSVRIRNQQY